MSASVRSRGRRRRRNRRSLQLGRRRDLQSHFGTERFSLQIVQPFVKNYALMRFIIQSQHKILCNFMR